jgi:hypothetical protein
MVAVMNNVKVMVRQLGYREDKCNNQIEVE